ncbi:MAG: hypothetical protein U5K79_02545 [Cyclobacteriaceae bacterium]|nr:hypothetical protein [Cyclobacteriaceae bacterium]
MNIFKSSLLIMSLGFCWISSYGQATKPVRVFLKNGAKIEGAIIGSFDDSRLYFTVNGDDSIAMKYDYIRKIKFKGKGTAFSEFDEKIASIPSIKTDAFYHEFRTGLLFGEEDVSFAVHTLNGYQFNQYLGTGLGIGLNTFGDYLTLPIYATVKGYILDRKVSPFYFGDIGYGFAWRNNNNSAFYQVNNLKGGYYWQLGLGYQVNFFNSALHYGYRLYQPGFKS